MNISPTAFNELYDSINKEDSDLFYIERGIKYIDLEILIDEIGFRGIELSKEEEYILFAELFIRDKIIVNGVPDDFDYSNETFLSHYRIGASKFTTPRKRPTVALTPGYTFQGEQNSCFAHAATNMIIHNIYKLTLDDYAMYEEKKCNQYLDTTKPLKEYGTILKECGDSASKRILLFHYIYRVITTRFGTNRGPLGSSILFYLQQPFRADIFPELNEIIHPIFQSKNLGLYTLSIMPIDKFDIQEYDRYFEEYYASIHIKKPAHFFTIVGIDDVVHGKDSSTGKSFTIPLDQFQSTGSVAINDSLWQSLSFVYLLFETSKHEFYPSIVKKYVEKATISVVPTPTKVIDPREAEEQDSPIKQPNFLEDTVIEKTDGGYKTRKRGKTRKTKRKRNRKTKIEMSRSL